METYREYDPKHLLWPELDDAALTRLRSIPFWDQALDTERKAGVMVSSYAATVSDPVLKEAIALQGKDEGDEGDEGVEAGGQRR
ncbi:hypothetical protein [Dendronalium phyllosphericum]